MKLLPLLFLACTQILCLVQYQTNPPTIYIGTVNFQLNSSSSDNLEETVITLSSLMTTATYKCILAFGQMDLNSTTLFHNYSIKVNQKTQSAFQVQSQINMTAFAFFAVRYLVIDSTLPNIYAEDRISFSDISAGRYSLI
jgi:hypothetical protein